MAVGLRIKLPGVKAEEFDRVDAAIDVRGNHPDGLIFSASGPVEDGWRVIDVWESRAHFDAFAAAANRSRRCRGRRFSAARHRRVSGARVRLARQRLREGVARMPAYIVLMQQVDDVDRYRSEYVPAVRPLLQKHGAELVVAGSDAKPAEGEAAK